MIEVGKVYRSRTFLFSFSSHVSFVKVTEVKQREVYFIFIIEDPFPKEGEVCSLSTSRFEGSFALISPLVEALL
jgi:hypothetical protein